MKKNTFILYLFSIILLVSCSKSSSNSPSSSNANVAGNWHGTIVATSNASANGNWVMSLTQNGNAVSGTISLTTYCCTTNALAITGTINGNSLQLAYTGGAGQANLNATISGTSLTGTFNQTGGVLGLASNFPSGTWQGTTP